MYNNNPGPTGANQNGSSDIPNDPAHDPIVIAAMFTAALWRESGIVVDAELLLVLFARFGLAPKVPGDSRGTCMHQLCHMARKETYRG